MRIVVIYTEQHAKSRSSARNTVDSGLTKGYTVEMYPGFFHLDVVKNAEQLGVPLKYKPIRGRKTRFDKMEAPGTRIANGLTHYTLYKWSAENDKPICILEHDARIINRLPKPIYDGIIQVSSHWKTQITPKLMRQCGRAIKMRKFDPERHEQIDMSWGNKKGIIKHPLSGTNGTSGYIIGPGAARKMVSYLEKDGVGFADRVREEHIGEGNLYLQVPQAVNVVRNIRSDVFARGDGLQPNRTKKPRKVRSK